MCLCVCVQVDLVKEEGSSAQKQLIGVAEQFNVLHKFEEPFWVSISLEMMHICTMQICVVSILSHVCLWVQVDLVKKEGPSAQKQMVRVAEQFNDMHKFEETFWVSALKDQGVKKLRDYLLSQ